MLIRKPVDIPPSEITDRDKWIARRDLMGGAAATALTAAMLPLTQTAAEAAMPRKYGRLPRSPFSISDEPTSRQDATTYNNFYEFGTGKSDPSDNAPKALKPDPWTLTVDGLAARTGKFNLEDVVRSAELEERIYRFRCVEAWSMVVPWIGVPLASVLKRFEPQSGAKYVAFQTLHAPAQMPGQRTSVLDWPYVEGLRIDEAMHPLALLTVGMYGEALPVQNGAPVRLIVPWKYGFKSIKSIVRISFVERQPTTTWSLLAPSEYGFYSNVNPDVDHPRWSQKKERPLGSFFKRPTLPFNGYADQVAGLYAGMDLKRFY